MNCLCTLDKIVVPNRLQWGGKAISLARLIEIGYPAPSTLVVSTEAMSEILPLERIFRTLDLQTLPEISNELQAGISQLLMPPAFIEQIAEETRTWRRYCVRSSAVQEDSETRAWAGILESYIDISLGEIEESIRRCLSSLYSLASLKYAAGQSISFKDLKMAVILQEYVVGQISGVGFSIDPVNHFENSVILEAAAGPAAKLTDGSVIPDRYVIEKTSGRILDARPGQPDGFALSRAAVIDLARQITRLERMFGHPVDVEWTIDNDVFVPLQARSVTTERASGAIAINAPRSYRFWWLDYDAMWQFEAGIRSFETERDVSANQLTDVIYVREAGSSRCLISVDDVMRLNEIGLELRSMPRFQCFEAECIRCLDKTYETLRALDNQSHGHLEPAQICLHLKAINIAYRRCVSLYRICDPYATNAIFSAVARFIPTEKLIDMIAPSDTVRVQEAQDWRALVSRDFDQFLAWEHVKTYPWLVPNLYSRDAILTTFCQKHRVSQGLGERRASKAAEFDISGLPDSSRAMLAILRGIADLRLRLKLAFTSFDFYFIDLYEAISRNTGVSGRELHSCYSIPDMIDLLSDEPAAAVKSPAIAHFNEGELVFVNAGQADEFWRRRSISFDHIGDPNAGIEIRGTVANHGEVSGRVRLLNCNDPDKANQVRLLMQEGDVLVSEMIQFNVMDLVQRAGGLITDEGGMLSHAAILAREMAIPCIVGTQNSTQVFQDGDEVEFNTKEGYVRLVHRARPEASGRKAATDPTKVTIPPGVELGGR